MWCVYIISIIIVVTVVMVIVAHSTPELDENGEPRNSTCDKCGSRDTKYETRWARGWNELCSQAYADNGIYCKCCGHVTFDEPREKHLEKLPYWCRAY